MKMTSDGTLTIERFILGPMDVNSYLVWDADSREALLIDPADASISVAERIRELGIKQLTLFLTHGHADHLPGVPFFQTEFAAKVLCSEQDAPMLTDPEANLSLALGMPIQLAPADGFLADGDQVLLGRHAGDVRSLPGHTRGSLVLIFPAGVFSGDTLFAGSIGRSDLPGGDGALLIERIHSVLLSLKDRPVYPGHGPATTIEEERGRNPFLNDAFF